MEALTPQVFEHAHFGKLRVVVIEGIAYFVGKDVAAALGYKDSKNALKRHVDPRDKLKWQIVSSGQRREMLLVNKSGVYSLILDSQLPLAKEYRHWVTSEVLPKVDEDGFFIREDVEVKPVEEELFDETDPAELARYQQHIRDYECGKILAKLVFALPPNSSLKEQLVRETANLLLGRSLF